MGELTKTLDNAAARQLIIAIELTPWRESTPKGMHLRSWVPTHALLDRGPASCDRVSDPSLDGAAAVARDEQPLPGAVGDKRWSWRIWTPIGTVWPYRAGSAPTLEAARAAADEALAALVEALGAERMVGE